MGITIDEILLNSTDDSITVVATDLDIRDLLFASDSVDVSGSSVTVSATDLDIRDLINTQDSIAIGDETSIVDMATMDSAFGVTSAGFPIMGIRQDASGSPVSATGDAHPMVFNDDGELKVAADLTSSTADDAADSGNPIKVGGRGVSGLLTALSATNDRYDLLGDLYRRTWVNNSHNIEIKTTAASVGTTNAEVVATPVAGRKEVTLQNRGTASVFLTHSVGSAKTVGIEIPKKSSATYSFGTDIDLFLQSDSGTQDIRILEAG